MVVGLHVGVDDLPQGAVLPRPRQLRPAGENRQGPGHRGTLRVSGQIPDRAGPSILRHPWTSLEETLGAIRTQREPASCLSRGAGLPRQAPEVRPPGTTDGHRGHGAPLLLPRCQGSQDERARQLSHPGRLGCRWVRGSQLSDSLARNNPSARRKSKLDAGPPGKETIL